MAIRENIKVGDVFVSSWGWEQTNIDFYEVVEKPSAATIIVREIGRISTDKPSGHDSEYCKPNKGQFVGEAFKARLDNRGEFKTGYNQWARKTDVESEHYRSWYA